MNIQKHAEVLEKLLESECSLTTAKLTGEEFAALNMLLMYAQVKGGYVVQEVVH
jgi:hypothetical protein